MFEGELGNSGVGERGLIKLAGVVIGCRHRRYRDGQSRHPRRDLGQVQPHRLGGERAGLVWPSGLQCRLDQIQHVIGHLVNIVKRPVSRWADPDRRVIRRLVVGFCEANPHRDSVRSIQEPLQPAGCGPGCHVSGVPQCGRHIASPGGQHPEIGEQLMTTQLAARDPLRHPQAGRTDLLSLRPEPGGDQIEDHDPPALDGINGRAVLAQLCESRLERSAKISHGPGAVRRERQQRHPLRR